MSALCNVCWRDVGGHDHSKCEQPWYTNHAEVCSFASMLIAHAQFQGESIDDSLGLLLYYFEKPWKWTPQRDAWVQLGRPTELADENDLELILGKPQS